MYALIAGPKLPMVYGTQNNEVPYKSVLKYLLHKTMRNQADQVIEKV